MKKTSFSKQALLTLALTWGLFAFALILSMAQTWTYPLFSDQKINSHALTETTIQKNYEGLIRYCLDPGHNRLTFRGLTQSRPALTHFAEVKVIFQVILWTGLACLLLSLIIGVRAYKKRDLRFLPWTFRLSLTLPFLLSLPLVFFFDRAFVLFHRLAFSNNYWIFDPATDPIINYLPETFFQNMVFLILGIWVFLLLILRFGIQPYLRKKLERNYS